MRFSNGFQGLALALAVITSVIVWGCGAEPKIDNAVKAQAAAPSVSPPDEATTDELHEAPPLHEAVSEGDADRVLELLAAGEDVNHHDPVFGTPLILALQSGVNEIVAAVLEAGANRTGTSADFLAAAELPRKTSDPTVRAVAEEFAERNQLTLRVDDNLAALLLFDVDSNRGQLLVDQHQEELVKQGWFLFRFAHDARRRQDIVGLLPTPEKYVVLAYLQTDGLNHNITTERIVDWLKQLEDDHPFVLTEVGLDYVGGRFLQSVRQPKQLAERMFAFCPDIVDQGVGTVANLETELAKPSPALYLWWD